MREEFAEADVNATFIHSVYLTNSKLCKIGFQKANDNRCLLCMNGVM